jgi:FkbM family methyltransferase
MDKKILRIYPTASVVAIEPVPANFARFSAMHAGDPRMLALNVAAGEHEGELELFVNDDDVGGVGVGASAYRYESGITNYSATTTSHRVGMLTLDQIVERHKDRIKGRVIIKIDVQGHEASVLRGAASLLKSADAVHVEVALFQYSGQEHGVTEIVPILSAAGLHLGPYQQCIGRVVSRYPYELDMLFVRQESLPRLLGY